MRGSTLIVFAAAVFLCGCLEGERAPEQVGESIREVSSMKALFIIAPERFREEELNVPKEKLEDNGVKVVVASTRPGEARGALGMRVTPDVTVDKVNVSEFDVVVVVGGPGSPQYLWKNTAVLSAVRDAYEQGKVVGGICMSAAVLANAGVLEGKRATVFATDETLQALEDGGAEYVSEDVVVDGMVVTAEGPNAAEEFGDRILKLALAKT